MRTLKRLEKKVRDNFHKENYEVKLQDKGRWEHPTTTIQNFSNFKVEEESDLIQNPNFQ